MHGSYIIDREGGTYDFVIGLRLPVFVNLFVEFGLKIGGIFRNNTVNFSHVAELNQTIKVILSLVISQ